MIDRDKHQQLRIGLASPEQICAWSKRILPNGRIVGQVTKPYTLHYKTNEPEKDGSFCERIFGPIKSGVCACGNSRVIGNEKENSKFCEQCGVEFVDSRIRRYRMGYIELACPVVHVWYSKRLPSYIANLLAKPLKESEGPVYCDVRLGGEITYLNLFIARPIANKPTSLRSRGPFKYEIQSWRDIIPHYFSARGFGAFRHREIATGGDAIREQLAGLNLQILMDRSYMEWKRLGKQKSAGNGWGDRKIQRRKDFSVRRMKLAKHFLQTDIEPEWMVLCPLPVLPPELRPIVQLGGGELITSDPNELYRRVIYRNNTLTDLLARSRSTPGGLVICQKKLVQEAVDALLDNGIRGQPMRDSHDRPYKSFSDVIEGKEGRSRENLLGKRVDYSGRSVIVVGPSLPLHQCGLPREIAIELFQAFVIRGLIRRHFAPNLRAAKSIIRDKEPIVWEVLQGVMQGHPVSLNRAPTLHRLGIQAFQPILVEGRAIRLHPLVCGGFNADSDGDQMAVHVPLSLEAQAEARLLMFSHTNLLSPAIGDPISVPTQDMLLGLYILTVGNNQGIYGNRYHPYYSKYKIFSCKKPSFYSYDDALGAHWQKRIELDSPLWLRWGVGLRIITSVDREAPIEVQYESLGIFHEIYEHYRIGKNEVGEILSIYIRTTVGRIRFDREIEEAIQGFSRASEHPNKSLPAIII
uniref:RNA polymerase beta' subunit n=1 Tax=Cycas crassipes TaxID=3042452 RepID=UPI001E72891F|nr:RNA polymerase beta' subunit [Cycas crassipes]YP_010900174.1 RNA polymerase beta' subunit [Cycas ferruginea]YP_010900260.1 RNA polymerase beta' subunit [Cycas guizhouensis]YP_010900432.1 RNA polymerase beta' subunit [Cycas longlinensis]UDU84195.1 RNA polymerase beta' subunit [Cycas ferruginea]WHS16436.1 RNA polymerase beta' subunit [Cycas crassipes]WHS16522.1 RNA polymerase beta' subunit [Cycas ferruginea]WHS16608.1 RNA polymerase beta' subunit [Cycas guizhouensis]WHS16780.1 RNA polymera